jgi:hypothetical protein
MDDSIFHSDLAYCRHGETISIFGGCGSGAGLTFLLLPSHEPSYQGKRLTVWVEQYSTNRFPNDYVAESAILHIGSNGPPIFLKWMGTVCKPHSEHQ